MINIKTSLFLLLSLFLAVSSSWSQCPSSITASATSAAATCTSNGSVTVTSNVGTTSGGLYQITEGPSGGGYQSSPQSSNVFNALPPGKYTITVSCGGTTPATTSVEVVNQYTPMILSPVVSNVCTNYQAGGVITLNTTGGSGPLQFAILLSTNPAEPEASFTFGNSNIFDVSAYGTYQVRVKDQCNNIIARTIELNPTTPKAKISSVVIGAYQPNPLPANCGKSRWSAKLADNTTGAPLGISGGAKYRLEVWESTSGCPGSIPTATPTWSKEMTSNSDLVFYFNANSNAFSYRLTSSCGEIVTGCLPLTTFTTSMNPRFFRGCLPTDNITVAAYTNSSAYPFTLSVTAYDAANNIIGTYNRTQDSIIFRNIPPADHYDYTFSDACNFTKSGTNIKYQTATPGLSIIYQVVCTNVLGTGLLYISSPYGDLPGYGTLEINNFKVINTATGASFSANSIPASSWSNISFYNVPPGNYVFRVPSAGGCVTDIPFTLSANAEAPLNNFTLNGTATQTCSGTGSIISQVTSNSTTTVSYTLTGGSLTTPVTNSSGTFNNLPAGTYTVTASLTMCGGKPPLTSTKQFTILPAGANPQITKKVGITCDNGSTGMASFEFAGTAPFKLEMKKTTENAFVVKDAASPATKMVTALDPGAIYDVRITDPCGNTAVTSVAIEPLTALNKLTTASPCEGQPYTLAVDNIPGATYSWTFNGGAPMSTSSKIEFSSYSATNDGTYACTMTINNCIVRTATYTISSKNCGSPLYVSFGNISASQKNGKLFVNWTSETEKDNVLFEIEASNDGKEFTKIGTVNSKAKEGNSSEKIAYSFELSVENATAMASIFSILLMTAVYKRRNRLASAFAAMLVIIAIGVSCKKTSDENLSTNGHQYIRIVTLDKQGNKGFSKVVKVIKE